MMVAVAAGLMAPLGWLVHNKAGSATDVALNQIDGKKCPEVPSLEPAAAASEGGAAPTPAGDEVDLLDEGAEPPAADEGAADEGGADEGAADEGGADEGGADEGGADEGAADEGAADEGDDGARARRVISVDIDDSEMPDPEVSVGALQEAPPTPEEIAAAKKKREACLAKSASKKKRVVERKSLISLIIILSGGFLILGLAVYGIKMTHKVAGPLFKVGLYLKKLEDEKYDTVYNLRKGDQLVEFYEHFKSAHAGLRKMQEEDRDRLKDAIALAKDAKLADKNPELGELIAELETMLKEKEESLG
jgi:hypothetical protein